MTATREYDYDWIVIGSGFGGSVAALRLAERGYSVCVLESGRRFTKETLPKSTWDMRNYFWMPGLGLRGILRISMFKDVAILSGSGVGGGSLAYAQTLYRATDRFRDAFDSATESTVDLDGYYEVAEHMLGVVEQPRVSSRDKMFIAAAADLGYGSDKFHATPIGVYRGEPGKTVADPYFGGEGPPRTGCIDCGQCMLGCKPGAKNTLDKNYLYLAERRGVQVRPDRMVTNVRPLGSADGSDGYEVVSHRPGAWVRRRTEVLRSRGVVFGAGAVGTNRLLASCRANGSLPGISDRLGMDVRTNAESVGAITFRDKSIDVTDGVAISGSLYANNDLHLENVNYGGLGDAMGGLMLPLSPDGSRLTRPLKMLLQILLHPIDFMRASNPVGWSKRSMIVGGMWTRDGALRFTAKPRILRRSIKLDTEQDPNNPNPTFIPEWYKFMNHLAKKYNGIPQIWATEPFNKAFTAHIIGGAVIATSPDKGVVDPDGHVFGYENMLVTDGSVVPFNPGVNPALTITALAERTMSAVSAKDGSQRQGGIGYRPRRSESATA